MAIVLGVYAADRAAVRAVAAYSGVAQQRVAAAVAYSAVAQQRVAAAYSAVAQQWAAQRTAQAQERAVASLSAAAQLSAALLHATAQFWALAAVLGQLLAAKRRSKALILRGYQGTFRRVGEYN